MSFRTWASVLGCGRSVRSPWIAIAASAIALALVLTALPGRMHAKRTDSDAWVPLRQLSLDEAAYLFSQPRGFSPPHVVELSADHVWLATGAYPLPVADPTGEDRAGAYTVSRSTFDRFCTLYELDRNGLEEKLGRRFGPGDIERSFLGEYRVSLEPSRLPRYIATECAFIALWLFSWAEAVRRTERWGSALGLAWFWLLLPMLFVFFYSPAFWDADFFFQRIVLEQIALDALTVCLFSGPILILYVLIRLAVRIANQRRAN